MKVGTNVWDTLRYMLGWPTERLNRANEMKDVKAHRLPSAKYFNKVKKVRVNIGSRSAANWVTQKQAKEFQEKVKKSKEFQEALKKAGRNPFGFMSLAPVDLEQERKWDKVQEVLDPETITLPGFEYVPTEVYGSVPNPDIEERVESISKKAKVDAERRKKDEREKEAGRTQELSLEEMQDLDRAKERQAVRDQIIAQLRSKKNPVHNLQVAGQHALKPYEQDLVLFAAQLASLAYHPTADVSRVLPEVTDSLPIVDFTREPNPEQDGFVGWDKSRNMIVVSFKGTNNMQDALTDANFINPGKLAEYNGRDLQVPLDGHGGFIGRFINISGEMFQDIDVMYRLADAQQKQHPKILFTGHSLGGALATVAAFVFAQVVEDMPVMLITFESPRVFSQDTLTGILGNSRTKEVENNAIRISVRNDVVPNVPPYNLGFRHVGRNYYIEDPKGAFIIPSLFNKKGMFHQMDNVKMALDEYSKLMDEEAKNDYMPLTTGRGKLVKKKKKTSAAMKARMAYVRSFKKK